MPTYQRGYKRPRSVRTNRVQRRTRVLPVTNRRRMVSLIRRTVLRTAELKIKYNSFDKVNVYHNGFYNPSGISSGALIHLNNAPAMPSQGTGDNQRIGDQMNSISYDIKLLFGQQSDRPNVNWRWIVLSVPKGATISYGNWFKQTTSNILLDDPNRDYVKVLKSGFMRPNEAGLAGGGGDEYTFTKRISVPYKKLVKFGPADGATTHNDNDIYLSIMGYDAFGTLPTDIVGYVQAVYSLNYRDP